MTTNTKKTVKFLSIAVFLFSSLLQGQSEEEGKMVPLTPVLYHPRTILLERMRIVDPSIIPNDFIRTYSALESVTVNITLADGNPIFREDIETWMLRDNNMIRYSLTGRNTTLNVEPILGFSASIAEKHLPIRRQSAGFRVFGTIGNTVTYYMKAQDNLTRGSNDTSYRFDRSEGFVQSSNPDPKGFDYDETEAQIGFHFGPVNFFFEKMKNIWGYDVDGNIILSDKAPSYPQIRLQFSIMDNVRLTYLHGFLYSDVLDSMGSYIDALNGESRIVYRKKYISAHLVEYSPIPEINIALGESIVFSDNLQPAYLIPILFYRSADHQNKSVDNAQIFCGLRYTFPGIGRLSANLFIDDLRTDKIFNKENVNIIAYSLTAKTIDLGIHNLDLTLEYTHLNPWVYTHNFGVTQFTSNDYYLGHWLGQNADLMYGELTYKWRSPLRTTAYFRTFRKGPLGDNTTHYKYPWKQQFLTGPLLTRDEGAVAFEWNPYQYFFLKGEAGYRTQHDDVAFRYDSYTGRLFFNLGIACNLFRAVNY
jgi:hypothetical protein